MRNAPCANRNVTKYSKALEVFEYLSYSAIESRDTIAAVLFGGNASPGSFTPPGSPASPTSSVVELPPASSENAAYSLVDSVRAIHTAEPLPRMPGDLRQLLTTLSERGTKRRSICIFTDQPLDEQADSTILDGLGALALRNDVTVCFLADAWETGMAHTGSVWSGSDSVSIPLSPAVLADYAEKYAVWSEKIRIALASRNIRSFHAVIGQDTGEELLRFLHSVR